eukprot:6200280-Pleurochrysis_carterae.AAC.3
MLTREQPQSAADTERRRGWQQVRQYRAEGPVSRLVAGTACGHRDIVRNRRESTAVGKGGCQKGASLHA